MGGGGDANQQRQCVIGNIFNFLRWNDDRRGRRGLSGSRASVQECGNMQGWRQNLGACGATARRVSLGGGEIQWRVCRGGAHGRGDECGWPALEFDWQSELQCVCVSLSRQRGLGGGPTRNRSAACGSDKVFVVNMGCGMPVSIFGLNMSWVEKLKP